MTAHIPVISVLIYVLKAVCHLIGGSWSDVPLNLVVKLYSNTQFVYLIFIIY